MVNWQQGKDQQDDAKYICKQDPQALGINTDSWEVAATDRDAWRYTVNLGLTQYEET